MNDNKSPCHVGYVPIFWADRDGGGRGNGAVDGVRVAAAAGLGHTDDFLNLQLVHILIRLTHGRARS